MIQRTARTLAETERFASTLARRLDDAIARGEIEGALIGLSGELGAGKTAFTRAFVRAIDPARSERVCSPTYALVQIYEGEPLIRHLDLYRLGSREELEAIGWRDLYFGRGLTLVEWIERVPEVVPRDWLEILLVVGAGGVREIRAVPHGERLAAILDPLEAV
ncbi:MAG: tRNA (adenosine(37)-N6)-threonylcarbamoyltransferase complex ATPase subunit type 1 TsaE [Deltaproteobacteria bacterium]|nr:tRNA (adenosine(37)-N6)-threonylcarbamoyltransferase complex ATPase subunit type 1 TsaE [Deltaproteobacteria bacterium]